MTKEKTSWDNIPSLDELSVDWSYEAEDPLGKREHVRICLKDIKRVLGVKSVPVRVITNKLDEKALFVDIDVSGSAVVMTSKLEINEVVKVGFLLGEDKIVSLAVVKNVHETNGKYRTGLGFKDLKPEYKTAIHAIATSKNY